MRNQVYNRLKELGFIPSTIIDCGACVGEWSGQIRQVYPDSFIIGIDASNWSEGDIPSTNVSEFEVLSNEDGKEIIFYKKSEGLCTGDSIFKENTQHYQEHNTIKEVRISKTLKTLCDKHNIDKIDLLKIDTQGSEILVMDGLRDKLNDVEFIELECSLIEWNIGGCSLQDVIDYLKDRFVIFDIIELHRLNGNDLFQVDIIFQNKKSKIVKPIW
jgi:FkbM family methyltransferase